VSIYSAPCATDGVARGSFDKLLMTVFHMLRERLAVIVILLPLALACVYVISMFSIDAYRQVTRAQPKNQWEAAQTVEGWRAKTGLPVYEMPEGGHTTHFYGALAPFSLAAFSEIVGFGNHTGRILQLLAALGAIIIISLALMQSRNPVQLIFAATILLTIHPPTIRYFTENRPDMVALLLGLISLVLFYRGYTQSALRIYALGILSLVIGVFHKQTVAGLALVPAVAIILEWRRPFLARLPWALSPGLAVATVIATLALLFPTVFFYMFEVPAGYGYSLTRLVGNTHAFLASTVLFAGILAVSYVLRPKSSDPRLTSWLYAALVICLLVSALSASKAGGWRNSYLPGFFALGALTVHRLDEVFRWLASSAVPVFRRLPVAMLISAMAVGSMPYASMSRTDVDDSWSDYGEVVAFIKDNNLSPIVSPEDPTIVLFSTGEATVSLATEQDVFFWPKELTHNLRNALTRATYAVDVIRSEDDRLPRSVFSDHGFCVVKSFKHYEILQKCP
jgi:hypothetical protein